MDTQRGGQSSPLLSCSEPLHGGRARPPQLPGAVVRAAAFLSVSVSCCVVEPRRRQSLFMSGPGGHFQSSSLCLSRRARERESAVFGMVGSALHLYRLNSVLSPLKFQLTKNSWSVLYTLHRLKQADSSCHLLRCHLPSTIQYLPISDFLPFLHKYV